MNHARITHIFLFLRVACVVCVIRRWIERGPSLIVSGCASKACVVYASSMRDYARDTRRPSVLVRRNCFETSHVHVRPMTTQLHITHEQRTYHVHAWNKSACEWYVREACVFGRALSVIHASSVHRMFVKYYTVFARICRCA